MRGGAQSGCTLIELLVGATLGLIAVAALTAAVAGGLRLLTTGSARGEAEDTVHLAVEALTFDVRRAGWDPAAAGVTGLTGAAPDRLAIEADLDGNGAVDATSEEAIAWVCASGKLSRLVGRQSLPLADGVTRCTFHYADATGADIAAPASGLDATDRRRTRTVGLDLTLAPRGLHAGSTRHVVVALRSHP